MVGDGRSESCRDDVRGDADVPTQSEELLHALHERVRRADAPEPVPGG